MLTLFFSRSATTHCIGSCNYCVTSRCLSTARTEAKPPRGGRSAYHGLVMFRGARPRTISNFWMVMHSHVSAKETVRRWVSVCSQLLICAKEILWQYKKHKHAVFNCTRHSERPVELGENHPLLDGKSPWVNHVALYLASDSQDWICQNLPGKWTIFFNWKFPLAYIFVLFYRGCLLGQGFNPVTPKNPAL